MDPLWIILGIALLLLVLGVLYVVGGQQEKIKQVARAVKPKQAKENKKDQQAAPKQQKAKPAAKQEKKKQEENVEVKAEKEKPQKAKKEKQAQPAVQSQPAQQPAAAESKKDKKKQQKAAEPELPADETQDLLSLHARSTKQQQVAKSEENLNVKQGPSEAQQAGWKVAGSINADVNAMKKNLSDKEEELKKAHSQTQVVERQLRDQKAAFTKLEKQKQEAEKHLKQQIEKLEAELKGKNQSAQEGHGGRHNTASPAQARREIKAGANPWSPHLADEIQAALKNAHQLKEDIETAVADHNARLGKGSKKAASTSSSTAKSDEEKGKEPATEETHDESQEETTSS